MYLTCPKKIVLGVCIVLIVVLLLLVYRYFAGFPYPYWKLFKEPFFYPFVVDEQKPHFIRFTLPNKIKLHQTQKQIRIHRHASSKPLSPNFFHIWYDLQGTCNTNIPQLDRYHWIVTTNKVPKRSNVVYIPHWSLQLAEKPWFNPTQLLRTEYSSFIERDFCVAVKMKKNKEQQQFVNLLSYYRPVDLRSKFADIHFEKYRFVVLFEEDIADGHISENFYLALVAGCIPVYFGAPDVGDHFNPRRFISVRDFATSQQCISHLIQIEDHRSEWDRIRREPNISQEKLERLVGWYFKHHAVFEPLFVSAPEFRCPDYTPLKKQKLDSSKWIKVINLDRSVDRWKNIQTQFESRRDYERFSAMEGTQFKTQLESLGVISSQKKLVQFSRGRGAKDLTNGEIGCYLSHMELYYALSRDPVQDFYLILEDDVKLSELDEPQKYVNEAPVDWDILYLGVNQLICAVPKVKATEVRYVPFESSCVPCTFAYLIRKRAAQFLLNFGLPMEMPIDQFIRSCSSNIRIYIRAPNVVWTDISDESTIGKR